MLEHFRAWILKKINDFIISNYILKNNIPIYLSVKYVELRHGAYTATEHQLVMWTATHAF